MRNKDKPVQFYVEEETKQQFEVICKKLCINKSEFFRSKMNELIQSNSHLLDIDLNSETNSN